MRVLVVAVSARMIAQLAVADGYEVTALDRFGDVDLRSIAPGATAPGNDALAALASGVDADAVVYGGGLENRPDLVAQLWHATDGDTAAIEAFGYRRLAPWVFVRRDSSRVDTSAVTRTACAMLSEDPFALGNATRSLPAQPAIVHRYCPE